MGHLELWCRVSVVGPDGAELSSHVLSGPGAPGMATVDDVARLALMAGRLGGGAVLTDVSPALQALLELAGLGGEAQGQAELGEEPLGAQEGQEPRHTGDLPL
jgi:hypothetical protein